jgi:hypothetical protein
MRQVSKLDVRDHDDSISYEEFRRFATMLPANAGVRIRSIDVLTH